jgi:hypothetical protein
MVNKLLVCSVFAGIAVAIACAGNPGNPVSPSAVGAFTTSAAADGSTLKATEPTPISPINNVKVETVETREVTLTIGNSTTPDATGVPLAYRFEIQNAAGALIEDSGLVIGGSSGTTPYVIKTELEGDQTYRWRARAEYQGALGPWSSLASFIAPTTEGYIRGDELYDPLINGKTVGSIHGPVTFIPGVGAKLETFDSWISYQLPVPLQNGEYSALVTGVATNTEGVKTRIFAMAEGFGDVTTNAARMTVEKRGDGPTGGIAWRFLTSDGEGVDTVGAERVVREFDPNETYLWWADWHCCVFRVRILKGGANGTEHYNFGKPYGGFYRPEGHVIYAGGGPARAGPINQTVPGMIIRQIWVSNRPRPAFANK